MYLSFWSEEGVNYPTIICSACGKPIKDARKAIIVSLDLGGNPISHATGVYHKGQCDTGKQAAPYWDELSVYLRQLVCNLKLGEMMSSGKKGQLVIDLPEPNAYCSPLCQQSRHRGN